MRAKTTSYFLLTQKMEDGEEADGHMYKTCHELTEEEPELAQFPLALIVRNSLHNTG